MPYDTRHVREGLEVGRLREVDNRSMDDMLNCRDAEVTALRQEIKRLKALITDYQTGD